MKLQQPAYITIVEGPPPDFQVAANRWAVGALESRTEYNVALVEMRTFDGPKLVKRCQDAWAEGRSARLDFPIGDGSREELDIIGLRWEEVTEGHKLFLWIRIEGKIDEIDVDIDEGSLSLF